MNDAYFDRDDALARASALMEVGRHQEAIELLSAACARDPSDHDALMNLALAYVGTGRPWDAKRTAERAVALEPESVESYLVLAQCAHACHRDDQALDAAFAACRIEPDSARSHMAVVTAALGLDDLSLAWGEANRVVELAPWSALGHQARGLVHLRRGDWHWAEVEYRQALAIRPEEPAYLNNLGLALMRSGAHEEALECFSAAGRIDPTNKNFRENAALAARGHVGGLMLPDWLRRFTQRRRLDGLSEPLQRELERKNREDEFNLREWRKARWGRWLAVIAFLAIPFMLAIAGPSTDEKPKFPAIEGCPKSSDANDFAKCLKGSFTTTTITFVIPTTVPTSTAPPSP